MALIRKPYYGSKQYEDRRFILAADIGQSNDPTAICVMEHIEYRNVHIRGAEVPAGQEFHVRHLQRLPLGLSYVDQAHHVSALLCRPPLNNECEFVIDDTGVGKAVGDIWSSFKQPTRVTITGGDKQSARGPHRWMVPKSQLISALDARLHTGELKIAADLAEAGVLQEELRDFRRHVSAAGRVSHDARAGKHDDVLTAVALALWCAIGRPKPQHLKVSRYHLVKPRR